MTATNGLSTALLQVGAITIVCLSLCGALAWWLYHREGKLQYDDRTYAEKKANKLLQQLLSPGQHEQLKTLGFLQQESRLIPGRSYRIPRHRGQVQIYEAGKHAGSLCIQPTRWVPDGDLVLMHKLMIEANESEYLRIANIFEPYRVG